MMDNQPPGILSAIVSFSLRFKGVVIALAFLLLVFGAYAITKAKYDVFPEFAPPQVSIQTEAPGLSPEQVEMLVTVPIENVVNGVSGIDSIRSSSIQGVSVIKIVFQNGTDIYRDRQLVAERLSTALGQLPQGVMTPVMTPLTSTTSVTLVLGLTSPTRSLMEMRTLADWTLRPRLLTVPGVANAVIFGGDVKQLQIQLKPELLVAHHLSVDDILIAARRVTGIRGAGFIETDNQRLILQTEGQFQTPAQLSQSVLLYQSGVPLKLGDVATVVEAPAPAYGAASIMGKPGVLMEVSSQFGTNTLEVTRQVEEALATMKPSLAAQGVTLHANLFRPASLIELSTRNVMTALWVGAILVMVVLFLFLFNVRSAAISCTAIPLSLVTAIAVMEAMGFTINTMTLGGLAIAIGEVVDDAVIDVENILRRFRENASLAIPKPLMDVALKASLEVRSAVVYATFAVALVFIPILSVSGVSGKLFQPLGIAYILSIFASLGVALTVTPALCVMFLSKQNGKTSHNHGEPAWVGRLKQSYARFLKIVEARQRVVFLGVGALFLIAMCLLPFFKTSFLPDLQEGHFIVHASTVPGTSLKESIRLGNQVTQELLALPEVRTVAQRVGRAQAAEDTWGTHYTEFDVDLKPEMANHLQETGTALEEIFAHYPYANAGVMTYLTEHIQETLSGSKAPVVFQLFGNDLPVLDQKAQEIVGVLNGLPGKHTVQLQSSPNVPQLMIQLREQDLLRWGLNSVDVLDVIRTAYQGNIVSQLSEGNQVFGVSVILDPVYRNNIGKIKELPMRTPAGAYIPLGLLADIFQQSGRYEVAHQGARRVQVITVETSDDQVNGFVEQAQKAIASQVKLPVGTYLEVKGSAEAQATSRNELIFYSFLVGIGILLLLSMVMGNLPNLLLVLVNLPFALIGGVFAIVFLGGVFSLGSMVGFVTLFGITLRNSIMLLSHYQHLVREEGRPWNFDTVILGASERLVPILMTALVTGLGLLPLALGSGQPGKEIEGPLAIVILGGLITSTLLNLVVLPTLAFRYGRFEFSETL